MTVKSIDSLETAALRPYRTLRGNSFGPEGSFVADSPRVVDKLLSGNLNFISILCTRDYFDSRRELMESAAVPEVYIGERSLLEQIVGHNIHHNVMAYLQRPPNVALEEMPECAVMLVGLSNMENVGAIARSAAALGVGGYIVPSNGPHPYGRRAIRVSTGHVTRLAVHTYGDIHDTLKELKSMGYSILAAETAQEAVPLAEFKLRSEKWVLLMGNEEDGIAQDILNICDAVLEIEMEPDIRSLNVAAAASITMYILKRAQ